MACARPPDAAMALVVSTSSSSERAFTATRAPRCASCSAMARPMPRPPPVIRAVSSRWFMDWSCVAGGGSYAGGSLRDDALAADGARHGDRADSRQRAVGAGGLVDRAGVGGHGAQQCKRLTGASWTSDSVPMPSVRRVQVVAHPDDSVRSSLSRGDRRHLSH
jgi:hypothetical protein